MKEWKPVVGYEDYYLVSNEADVFSLRNNRLIKVSDRGNGYYAVELNVNGKAKKESIHRLVAKAFIPNPDNLPFINHKDENPANNHADNLEWCTPKYNQNYGTIKERRKAHTVFKYGDDNPNSIPVYQFDLEGNFIARYGSAREAQRATELDAGVIGKVCKGIMKKYGGYYWSFTNKFEYDPAKKTPFANGAVLMYDSKGNFVKRYETPRELHADGFTTNNVGRVIRGERHSYKGYVFKRES